MRLILGAVPILHLAMVGTARIGLTYHRFLLCAEEIKRLMTRILTFSQLQMCFGLRD